MILFHFPSSTMPPFLPRAPGLFRFFSQCPKTLPGVGAELPPDPLKARPSMFPAELINHRKV